MEINIIPQPARVAMKTGLFTCDGLPAFAEGGFFANEIATAKRQLAAFAARRGVPPMMGKPCVTLTKDAALKTEAYHITLQMSRIDIAAGDAAGAHNALETLRQLVFTGFDGAQTTLPCAEIDDSPRFPWRGFMLDTSRHYFEPSSIKKLLDALSLHHINVFHWHLSDDQGWRFAVPEYPRLIEVGSVRHNIRRQEFDRIIEGSYSDEVIRDIVEYAAALHITIVPEVDLPGHTSSVLAAYPALGCTGGPYAVEDRHGIFPDILCAGNDAIFDFADAVFRTLARLFPGDWIHIGGDEAPRTRWAACPKCAARIKEAGLPGVEQLQSWCTEKFAALVAKYGKKVIGWDEILDGAVKLPDGVAVMSWRSREGGEKAAAAGHPVVMTPQDEGFYLNYRHTDDPAEIGEKWLATLEQCYNGVPTRGMEAKAAMHVLGGQANLWSELIYADRIAEYMLFPRVTALAEAFWTQEERRDFSSYQSRLKMHEKRFDDLGLLYYRRA